MNNTDEAKILMVGIQCKWCKWYLKDLDYCVKHGDDRKARVLQDLQNKMATSYCYEPK
jgi:hypothetical protein